MGQIEITGVWEQRHILGDGDNIIIAFAWPDGSAATAFVYIDHNMGTVAKDAFVIPEAGESVLATMSQIDDDPNSSVEPFDAGVARARIEDAIASGERVVPPLETDSWPPCRPMIEWLTSHLPEGAVLPERPDWTEAEATGCWRSSSPQSTARSPAWTPTMSAGWPIRWCGSAATTAPATRSAGAPWSSRSSSPTCIPARSSG